MWQPHAEPWNQSLPLTVGVGPQESDRLCGSFWGAEGVAKRRLNRAIAQKV
jgi:hypothetical protein